MSEPLLQAAYSSLVTEGVYKKLASNTIAQTGRNAGPDTNASVRDALIAKLRKQLPEKGDVIAKLTEELMKANAQTSRNVNTDDQTSLDMSLQQIVSEELEAADIDALVLSSVLGAKMTPLTEEERKKIYSTTQGSVDFEPIQGNAADEEGKKFLAYLQKDKVTRYINECVLGVVPDPTLIDGSIDISIEEIIRIALVLARNHDLCQQAYSSKPVTIANALSRSNPIVNYTDKVVNMLMTVSPELVEAQYKIVHRIDTFPEKYKQQQSQTQGTPSSNQIFRALVAPTGAGGAARKKKNKPKKKTT